MRLLGITAVLAGLVVLYRTVSISFDRGVGLVTLALCSLFPGLIVQATEIRPYAIFFLFSVLALDACLRLDRQPATLGAYVSSAPPTCGVHWNLLAVDASFSRG